MQPGRTTQDGGAAGSNPEVLQEPLRPGSPCRLLCPSPAWRVAAPRKYFISAQRQQLPSWSEPHGGGPLWWGQEPLILPPPLPPALALPASAPLAFGSGHREQQEVRLGLGWVHLPPAAPSQA